MSQYTGRLLVGVPSGRRAIMAKFVGKVIDKYGYLILVSILSAVFFTLFINKLIATA